MPTPTYDLIEEKVLGSAAATITFSSIPGTYTHLDIEVIGTDSAYGATWLRCNGDSSSTNYSHTILNGNGTSATSTRGSNVTGQMNVGITGTGMSNNTFTVFNYASTNVQKTVLGRGNVSTDGVRAVAGLWRGASGSPQAITSITIGGTSFQIGTTFRLWGIA